MPTLAEAATTPYVSAKKRTQCGVADWIDRLPEPEAKAALQLLADTARSTASLHVLFVENSFPLRYNALLMHRSGRCSCP
jgi:hypothetical protein